MTHRPSAVLALSFFLAGIVSPAAEEVVRSALGSSQVSHDEGSPCPDPDNGSHPCGPACACVCCGRHVQAQTAPAQQVPFAAPPVVERIAYAADLLPQEVHFRVFHPPRV